METSNKTYIAYYRVSTQKQGNSGLGLEAQKTSVVNFVGCADCIINEFTEIESGKKADRIELNKALAQCKATGATLIIAKLDRLSRDVEFIAKLQKSEIAFKCVDMPEADNFTITIIAAVAQRERELISSRTKAALAASNKLKGVEGANNMIKGNASAKGVAAIKAKAATNPNNVKAIALATSLKKNGCNNSEIARQLNAAGFMSSRGKAFAPNQVTRLFSVPS